MVNYLRRAKAFTSQSSVTGAGEAVGRVVTAHGTAILGDGRISGEVTA